MISWRVALFLYLGLPAAFAGGVTSGPPVIGGIGGIGGIPLTVAETAGVARQGEVITNGVPLPRSLALRDPGRLTVVDPAGRPVPAEFTVLARWNAGRDDPKAPVEWLLVAFPATVGAKEGATYRLVTDGSAGKNPPPPHPLRLTREGDTVTVDTGAAIFRLGADRGALFDEVRLAAGARLAGGGRMTARVREATAGHSGLRAVRVERQGPLTAVVVVTGTYDLPPAGGGGLGSLRRYVFAAGSPTALVRQAVAWEGNLGCNGCLTAKDGKTPNALLLTRVRDELALDLGGTSKVTAVGAFGSPAVERAVPTGQEAAVRQLLRAQRGAPLRFEVQAAGSRATGDKADGGMLAASGVRGTIAVALNHMHRYEPQALRLLASGALAVDLADDKIWLAHHQGMFASFAVAALPPALKPTRQAFDREVWAPLNHPLRAWPDAGWFAASGAVEEIPAGPLPAALAGYDSLIQGALETTVQQIDHAGIAGLMTFGVYPRYWGRWGSPELTCRHDPTPGETWDDTFWCGTWTDYHNTLATAPLWAMRSGEVSWLDEIGFPGALRTLHTQIMQCAPGDPWFYCGQAPAGYGGYRSDFNSSHAYFDNLFLYYWLTGDSTVVDTLRKGGETMRRHMCDLRGPETVPPSAKIPSGPAGPACPDDRPNPRTGFNGRVDTQWLAVFRFLGHAGPDPSFLADFRSGLSRAVTQEYIEVERDGRSYGFLGETAKGPGTFTTNQLWQIGLLDAADLHRFAVDSGDAPLGTPPLKPSRVLAALARTVAEIEPKVKGAGSLDGHWPLRLVATWSGARIGGRLLAVHGEDRDLYEPEKATLAALVAQAGASTGDRGLQKTAAELVAFTLRAAAADHLPLGKLDGQYLSRLHAAIASLLRLK